MTNWLERRIEEHETGLNETCYTHGRRPLKIVYFEYHQYVWNAIKREKQIKNWSRDKKIALINGDIAKLKELSSCKNSTHHSNYKIDKSVLSGIKQKRRSLNELSLLRKIKIISRSSSEVDATQLYFQSLTYSGARMQSKRRVETDLSDRAESRVGKMRENFSTASPW
jgi:putative endonuclease